MSHDVILPKLSFSMNDGIIAEWLVEDGGQVEEGQPLLALESDKSTIEVEAPATGRLKIIGQRGETYDVGTVLAQIL
jgi:pyruvate/2-oxoglutarate dehydrogenase complex dihydrolipoamide acyltransferase (E2) component